jgi:hypothetical protein
MDITFQNRAKRVLIAQKLVLGSCKWRGWVLDAEKGGYGIRPYDGINGINGVNG